MGSEEIQAMQRLLATANTKHHGHLAILKSGVEWRVSFSTPTNVDDVAAMARGRTFVEAAKAALAVENVA